MLWCTGLLVMLGLSGSLWAKLPPPLPTVVMNLNLCPEKRWEHLQTAFDANSVKKATAALIDSQIPKWVHRAVIPIGKFLEKYVPQPYAGEIRGIARVMKINLAEAIILNFAYEFTAFCTSIVAQDNKGNIYHGRNFDFPDPVLRTLTMNVVFIKDGKPAYFGTSFAGYVGIWTGMSPYKFTVSGNQRGTGEQLTWWKNAVSAVLFHNSPVSWLVRESKKTLYVEVKIFCVELIQTLEEATDFEDAVTRLSTTPIISGVYYIVGGVQPGEGVVITRDRNNPADIGRLEPLKGGWYRVQTNVDHWLPPSPSHKSMQVAIKKLNTVGQNRINKDKLNQVLSLSPVCNRNTIFTTSMSAATPWEYATILRPQGCPGKKSKWGALGSWE